MELEEPTSDVYIYWDSEAKNDFGESAHVVHQIINRLDALQLWLTAVGQCITLSRELFGLMAVEGFGFGYPTSPALRPYCRRSRKRSP